MRDTVLSLLFVIAVTQFGVTVTQNVRSCDPASIEAQRICMSENNENGLVVHKFCNKFYKCSNGKAYPYECPSILLYDPVKEECDWPHLVECGDRPISDNDDSSSNDTDCVDDDDTVTTLPPNTDNDSGNDIGEGTCNCNPDEAPSICAAEGSNGILVAHENCNQFYICAEGVPVALVCPGDLLYNPYTKQCDYETNVDCGDRVIPKPEEDNDENNDNNSEDNGTIGGGNCDPSQAPSICAATESEGVLVAHENCNQFYMCSGGVPVALFCPPNLFFNPHTDQCEWPTNVDCEDRIIPDSDDSDSANNDNSNNENDENNHIGGGNCDPSQAPTICAAPDSDGILVAHEKCNQFYKCFDSKPVAFLCPGNLLFNPNIDQCDWPENVDCGDRLISDPEDDNNIGNDNDGNDSGNTDNGENDNGGTCNCNPGEASSICAGEDSDGILVAHENCNQFYKCDHGEPVVFTCPPYTLYNPYKEQCDWASEVDCGDRVIPETDEEENLGSDSEDDIDDNLVNDPEDNGTCNCNPEEATSICAAQESDGVLVAHKNCNQFYKCDHGEPVVFTCPPHTLYNPYKEECDWASNVECGDRIIPDDNGNNDNGGNDNDNNDNGGNDNGDNDNGGICNCNPGDAPSICAGEDSNGVLVAHENCNQFYKCDHGEPVVFTCPPDTLYNPYKEECDWGSNVECDDRVVTDPDNNDDGNDNGDNDNGGNDNDNNDNGGTDNDGNDNGGTCNCNPGEAPTICAGEDSAGVLIAHENCNQFYKCDHGKPVVFTCPPNTLYNPYKEECDWASNVECGDRLVPDPDDNDDGNDNGDNDNGGNDNDNNDNGGNDNGGNDNGGTCNCNPGEAPTICAGEDSAGVLVAHENCNQFYKCDHGKPVVFTCPPNTLYNPYKEECDWASNVECDDRVVPDPDDNDNGNDNGDNDNGGNDNDNNDNGGNDNGGNDNGGTCNCNPGEAPTICAGEDSSGVLVAHENCNQFYKCDHGKPVVFTCPPNTLYNPYKEECDWASNVECGDRVVPDPDDNDDGNDNGDNDNGGNDNDNNDNGGNDNGGNDNGGTCNCNPGEAPTICAGEDSSGVLVAHENCNQFYKCDHGKPVVFTCPPNTLYNPYKEECDWASNVECDDRVVPDPDDNDSGNDNGDNDNGANDDDNNNNGGNDNGGNDNGGTCNCNPGEAPTICAGEDSSGVLVAHENCNQFYKCDHGKPVVFTCPPNTLYNPYREECDWASNVECDDRVVPDPDDNDDGNDNGDNDNGGNDNDNNDNGGNDNGGNDNGGTCNCNPGEAPTICAGEDSAGVLVAHENCNQFYKCDHGKPVVFTCPPNTLYNPYKEECDWASNVECDDRVVPDPDDNDSGNDNGDNDNGANDDDNNDNGGNDNGGNDNGGTCNCNPGEAPTICAGEDSSGVLVAHENCNQFYKCDHGKPVVFTCPPNTLYNPYREECDWASNVECDDRVVPDPDDNDDGNDNGDNDNGGNGNDNNDNGGNDNGDNDNGGTCNCNPGEAPTICAGEDSSGVLVAHENCNQFYKCDHGKPVVFTCPPNTLYNPYEEECDWASNVECDDRVIPEPDDNDNGNDNGDNDNGGNDNDNNDNGGNDNGGNDNGGTCNCNPGEAPTICAGEDSAGVLVAHENCNQFYKCDHGKPVVFTCPPNTLYNPYKEECDWASNVECDDRVIPEPDDNDNGNDNGDNDNGGNDNDNNDNGGNDNGGNDNGGTCNCNPGEAPTICAGEDSSGVLVAHENCNQFYKCDHGKPVVFTCPPNTLYNPYTEECDWASNVECGDRVVPDPDDNDDGNDNDNDNDSGNDNNDNDSEGDIDDNLANDFENDGTCNCNPEEATSICAGADSDGVLVAHENCNQFYKCDHGKPVVFTCPPNTLYNPYREECDWASNVECDDRVVPDPDDNDNGNDNGDNDNGGNDNDNNDNGGNDNGGNDNGGTCNCNPGEAPTICAGEDSSGVLVAHENCNQFYKCDHGKPVVFTCPPNTLYNPYTEECDWASNVECGDRVVPDPDDNDDGNDNDNNNDSGNDNNDNDSEDDIDDNLANDSENDSTCNCNPEEAPSICAGENSDGVLVAHENCNQFYKCYNNQPIAFTCPPNTLYSPYKEECDWVSNVECGDRVIPDLDDNIDENENGSGENDNANNDNGGNDNNDTTDGNDSDGIDTDNENNDSDCDDASDTDNNGTCNCNPEQAPTICSSQNSDGILIAHENCNQFYQCSSGSPIAFTCPAGLLYNPVKEECDWAIEVDCGDRLIPDPNEEGDSSSDNDDTSVSNPEDVGSCNCNPSEAPVICAGDNSDGFLIAHENCNQFYICSNGLPVALKCPGNTLYNPYQERCDWTSNVECGERVIPDSEEDDNNNNDSNIDDENNNVINDDPSQAPAICAEIGSDGTLVAHENCNQFYQCSNGLPIAISCAEELLFNPTTQQCDWPFNVDCGDRNVSEIDEECACNPRNAPALCSREDSNGKLIAHENCHQFYVCVEGVPLARYCPSTLFYNIEKEVCDWPQNVNCYSRNIIPYSSINKHLESRQTLRK